MKSHITHATSNMQRRPFSFVIFSDIYGGVLLNFYLKQRCTENATPQLNTTILNAN